MIDNSNAWLTRANEILARPPLGGRGGGGSEAGQFAASLLTALYGPRSSQLENFVSGCRAIERTAANPQNLVAHLNVHAHGVIRNAVAELQSGLVVRLRIVVAGEILAELVRLAKDILVDRTEAAKDAAAVLCAGAYEGLIRKMGEEFAGVANRPKLEEVIGALKAAGALKGGEVGLAQSYLKFRNDSLHSDWKKVDRSQVDSCLSFTEALLVKHFGS